MSIDTFQKAVDYQVPQSIRQNIKFDVNPLTVNHVELKQMVETIDILHELTSQQHHMLQDLQTNNILSKVFLCLSGSFLIYKTYILCIQ